MTENNNEKIFIGIDNKRIELKGVDKDNFIAQREADKAALQAVKVEEEAKEARIASAKAKLEALGLTTEEIKDTFGL